MTRRAGPPGSLRSLAGLQQQLIDTGIVMQLSLANVGLPMIFWQIPAMLIALAPVVAIESVVVRREANVGTERLVIDVFLVNLASTLAGIPIAWILMFMIEMIGVSVIREFPRTPLNEVLAFLLSVAWLWPTREFMPWIVPAATLVLLVPYCLASVIVERAILVRRWSHIEKSSVCAAVWRANLISYAALFIITTIWFVQASEA